MKGSSSQFLDALGDGVAKVMLVAQGGAQSNGKFVEFVSEAFFGFLEGGRIASECVPGLDEEFTRDGGDGYVAAAFAGQEFPAPFA